jgi:hypothetical protein
MGAVNRDDLDGFFARADDVLTDCHGSPDAMYSADRAARLWFGAGTRPWSSPSADVLADLRTAMETNYFLWQADELLAAFVPLRERNGLLPQANSVTERPTDPYARALEARRTRNTGPPDQRRLDGRRRRR